MARRPNSQIANDQAPSKRDLQRQIGRTRESLSETVEEIKDTAEQGYASVKETVSGVLDYRDEFQKEPLVWSLGALSAGFALGYAVGYAHKFSTKKAGNSQVAQFTDRMVDELSKVGQSLVVPALATDNVKQRQADFLNRIRAADPQHQTIDRAMLNDQNELGLILDRTVEMDRVPDLMRSILTQMAREFPGEDLTVLAYTPSNPPHKIGTARLNAQTRDMSYTPTQ